MLHLNFDVTPNTYSETDRSRPHCEDHTWHIAETNSKDDTGGVSAAARWNSNCDL